MNRIFLSLLMASLPLVANADAVKIGSIWYNLESETKTAEVSSSPQDYYSGKVTIPSSVTYEDVAYNVTRIGDYAFGGCESLTSVIIPESVTSIGQDAFRGCSNLASVNIPEGVTNIEEGTFAICESLTSITIPESVTSISDYYAFVGCISLTTVTLESNTIVSETTVGEDDYRSMADIFGHQVEKYILGDAVTSIGNGAFASCESLTSINIPNVVTSIGAHAFDGCSNLNSIIIPEILSSIEEATFAGCESLTSINIPDGVKTIGPLAFCGCCRLDSINIPENLSSIEEATFAGCESLTSVIIPENVNCIGDNAFQGCSGLNSVTIPENVTSIGNYVFWDCENLIKVTLESDAAVSSSRDYWEDSWWNDGSSMASIFGTQVEEYVLGDAITFIGDNAFANCKSLTSINIPDGVTGIGDYAFANCESLISITISEGVTSIGDYAFSGCGSLSDVIIPESVISINEEMFPFVDTPWYDNQEGLIYVGKVLYEYKGEMPEDNDITIKDGTVRIASYAFYRCENRENLISVAIPESVTSIGAHAFDGCSNLNSIIIPEILSSIEEATFAGCESLISINIPHGVTSIGYDAFNGCSGLESITIPESVTSIDKYAFGGCESLTTVTLESDAIVSVTEIYDEDNDKYYIRSMANIFGEQVEEYIIGDAVKGIGDNAFYDCTSLTSVTIGSGVTHIGSEAFGGCTGLTSVTIPNSVTSIGYEAFNDCTGLTSVTIGNGVTHIGEMAFCSCPNLATITFGSNVRSIGYYAFDGTAWFEDQPDGLVYAGNVAYRYKQYEIEMPENTEIVLKDGTIGIASYAFEGCYNLTSITIPSSVTSIGDYAFSDCYGLTSITVQEGNPVYDSRNGCNALIETATNTLIKGCNTSTIPDGVVCICDYAFYDCENLVSVIIPSSVTSIGDYAFSGCYGLTSIIVKEGNPVYDSRNGCNALIETTTNTLIKGCNTTTIPDGVACIGEDAFYGCVGLTSVSIPESVISIGKNAFYNCFFTTDSFVNNSALTSSNNWGATLCDEVTDDGLLIKDHSVVRCRPWVTSVIIPDGVTNIWGNAFADCRELSSIKIPESVTSIGSYAFDATAWYEKHPNGLVYAGKVAYKYKGQMPENTEIVLEDGTLGIADGAFGWHTGLIKFTIPESVTNIGGRAFSGCSCLTSINISEGVTSIGNSAFYGCSSLTSINIPEGVTSIGNSAFYECSGLKSITIPNSVTSIGNRAFSKCSGLTSIIVEEGNPVYDSRKSCNALIETTTGMLVKGCDTTIIPDGVTGIGESAFEYCSGLTSAIIPESVTSIGRDAFYCCSGLTSVTIPNCIIDDYAFSGCSNVENLSIDCEDIGRWFSYSKHLQTLFLGKHVKTIGSEAFLGCSGLISVTIPESVTSISEYAFNACSSLSAVHITDLSAWCNIKFGQHDYFKYSNPLCYAHHLYLDEKEIKDLVIPDDVTDISYFAFYGCSGLTSVTIPNSVNNIGNSAFSGCSGLISVTIPDGVSSIGVDAFNSCTSLTSITIPNSVSSIGDYAFGNCYFTTDSFINNSSVTSSYNWGATLCDEETNEGLLIKDHSVVKCRPWVNSVTVPNSVTSIYNYAFSNCISLTSITIPNSVTSIDYNAFYNCCSLTDVYCFVDNVPATSIYAFDNTPIASATLHVPEGSMELYKTTSPWSSFGSIVPLIPLWADVEINKINFPDDSFREWVEQEYGTDGVLTGIKIASVTYINVNNRGIQSMKGIEYFAALTELDCSYNLLNTLDVSKNTKLNTLNLSHNKLTGDIAEFCECMISADQVSPIISLNISDNKLSGNIGLFANHFANLKSLDASGNCLEDVNPMIPATVTSLDISRQTISRVVPLDLANLSVADIASKVPSILLYDHANQTYISDIILKCNTADNSWSMMMSYQNGQLAVPFVSEQNTYYGESGDILNVEVYNNDGTPEGSTFCISLSFDEGDGNFDGQVNVLDLETDILYIMEKYLTRPYNFTAANLWDDNLINVQDVIRLVDLLMNMEQTETASDARRKAQEYETNSDASIYIQDGQLMLNTNEPVAALDLLLNKANSINMADYLERMGMSVVTKKASDGLHIIAYSMSGNYIPSGISTIGTVDSNVASVRSVMLSDSEANAISVSIDNDATGIHSIENGKLIIGNEDAVYDLSGRQIVNGRLKRGVYIKNGRKIAK